MLKPFCDQCKREITADLKPKGGQACGRLGGRYKNISFEVMVGKTPGSMNTGDYCWPCILEAINQVAAEIRSGNDEKIEKP